MLGLAPAEDGKFLRFGVAPYGGSNIVGTQIHQKLKSGVSTGEFCIAVLVNRKPSKGEKILTKIPEIVDDIPTDVIELGEGVQHAGDAVIGGGGSVGFEEGTVGAVVGFGDGDQYVLSNQHVLNPSFAFGIGNAVFNGGFGQQIGELTAWSEQGDPELDAAIAQVTVAGSVNPLYGGLALDPNPMTEADVQAASQGSTGFLVKKYGQETGLTHGFISSTGAFRDVTVKGTLLKQQWVIRSIDGTPFSRSGDSGSLIIGESNNRPVGLLWGADQNINTISYANRISIVKLAFGPMQFL